MKAEKEFVAAYKKLIDSRKDLISRIVEYFVSYNVFPLMSELSLIMDRHIDTLKERLRVLEHLGFVFIHKNSAGQWQPGIEAQKLKWLTAYYFFQAHIEGIAEKAGTVKYKDIEIDVWKRPEGHYHVDIDGDWFKFFTLGELKERFGKYLRML